MAGPGFFDETGIPAGWFDETADASGWFDDSAMGAEAAAESSTDAALAEPFKTRVAQSRRQLAAGWMAGMAAQVQAAVVPFSAWARTPAPRRKATERRIVEAPALHWQYIAPTVAAILPRPVVKVIEFRRKVQEQSPLILATPPTGPPSTDSSLAEPFTTKRTRSRRLIQPLTAPQFPATPPALTAQGFPAYLLRAVSRSETRRRLQVAIDAPVYPQPSTPPVVEFAAFTPVKVCRRKSSGMGFVAVDFTAGNPAQAPTTTPAVHPAHVQIGYLRRRETDRRHLTALVAPVFPATPAVEGSTDSALAEPFITRLTRSRRLLVPVVTPDFPATPPSVTAAVFPSFVPGGFRRRPPRNAGFVAVDSVSGNVTPLVSPYPSYVPQGFRKRATTERRHLAAIDAPSKPQTPPAPEQPFTAFKLAVARYVPAQRRTHLFVLGPLHVEGSPPSVVTPDTGGGGWWPPYDYYRHRKELERRERHQRKVEAERIEDETAREIARLLHEQEQRDAERADMKRLQRLVDDAQAMRRTGLFNDAIERRLHLLAIETTISQLLAFEREMAQQIEDEEMAALLLILAEETD